MQKFPHQLFLLNYEFVENTQFTKFQSTFSPSKFYTIYGKYLLIILEKINEPRTERLDSRTDSPGIIIYAWPKSADDSQGCKAFKHIGQ